MSAPKYVPDAYRDHFDERLAIMEAEGVIDAPRKAAEDVQRMASREQGELFA